MRTLILITTIGWYACLSSGQPIYPFDPNNPPIQCQISDDWEPPVPLDEIVGTHRILWIVAAADSNALPQEWPVHERGDDCGPFRIMNPSTYQMPSWASSMFDLNNPRSMSSYYFNQSSGRFTVEGNVVGRDSLTIFTCDPDTSVRPRKCGTSFHGGKKFFRNIMQKVDSVVNFADYLATPNSTSPQCIIFHIYGHAENCQSEGGGVSCLADTFTTRDTNDVGQLIRIYRGNGVTGWSTSEQALSVHDSCTWIGAADSVLLAYYFALGIGTHEYTHRD